MKKLNDNNKQQKSLHGTHGDAAKKEEETTQKILTKNNNKQQQKNKQSLDGTHGDAAKKEKETKQKLTTDTHFPLFKWTSQALKKERGQRKLRTKWFFWADPHPSKVFHSLWVFLFFFCVKTLLHKKEEKRSRRTRRVRQVEILGEEDAYMGDVSLHQRLYNTLYFLHYHLILKRKIM